MRGCAIEDCGYPHYARGWCSRHYYRWLRQGDPLHGHLWSETQLRALGQIMRAFPYPEPLPPKTDLENVLGHPIRSIMKQARGMGFPTGQRKKNPSRLCQECSERFFPRSPRQMMCSAECGNRNKWVRNAHPRGMKGKTHTSQTKKRLAEQSQQVWKEATPEQRAAMLEPMRKAATDMLGNGPRVTRYTSGRGGRRADLGGQYFRSSWEANYARYLNWLVDHGDALSWEYEPRTFEFPVRRGNRFYTPDFRVCWSVEKYEWHEVKGWMDQNSKVKLGRFKRYYPDEPLVLIDRVVYAEISEKMGSLIDGWETGREPLESVEAQSCGVELCNAPVIARGWCSRHYQRWLKTGDACSPDKRFKVNR